MLKKVIAGVLALIMVLTALPLSSVISFAAEKTETVYYDFDLSDYEGEPLSGPSNVGPMKAFSGSGSFNFYSYLDTIEKNIYNKILEKKAGLTVAEASATKDTDTEAVITFSVSLTNAQWDEYWNGGKLNSSITRASRALAYDYNEFFWMGAFSIEATANTTSTGYIATIRYKVRLKTTSYPNWAAVIDYYYGLMDAVENFTVTGSTRYEKVKSIHDSICKMVTYDYDFNNPIAHEPVSVFFEPYEPVCEGYAEAFKLICDRESIPCVRVSGDAGGDHAWNYVKMENGNWYAVDVTWDDQSSIRYDYFLVGSDTIIEIENVKFCENHIPQESYGLFDFPELSKERYYWDAKNGWLKEDGFWFYYVNDVAKTGWVSDNGRWYYFDENGAMQTDWQKIKNKWYYFGGADSGAMRTGWQKLSGKWYYFGGANDGVLRTGWQKLSGKWYYFGGADSGAMRTGWQKINNKWYYFGGAEDGKMKTGWQKISNKWYYLGGAEDGVMKTGWQKISNKWYYFETSGVMRTANLTYNGKVYKFNSSGVCLNP